MKRSRSWRGPTFVITSLSLAISLATSCGGEAPDRPTVVLVTLDTTRADALAAYGGPAELTPNLNEFAREARLFYSARTVAPITLPAHASMFTGLYPPRHTIRNNGPMFLPSSAETLAEVARDAGYQTAAFVSSVALDRAFGLDQGFELYDQPELDETDPRTRIGERPDAVTAARAVEWLAKRDPERPLFLWVHFFDPHTPYVPAAEFLERAQGEPYLGEVAAMDAAFGELVSALRVRGLYENAVFAVVGDHGESLGDHGEPTHGLLCYDSTLRVPFLLRHPQAGVTGGPSTELVSVVDVYPTLRAAFGVPPGKGLDGRDLLAGAPPADRGIYFESYYGFLAFGWSPLAGWMDGSGKYVHGSTPQLFDPRSDPREVQDRYDPRSTDIERYRTEIARVSSSPVLAPDEHRGVDEELLARVGDLGYAMSLDPDAELPDPLQPNELPAPQDRMAEFEAYNDAENLCDNGHPADAIPLLEEVLKENPRNVWAMNLLGRALLEVGDHQRALEVYRLRLELPPELTATHVSIAACLQALGGDDAERKRHLRRGMLLMAEAHERRGELEQAEHFRSLLQRAIEQDEQAEK